MAVSEYHLDTRIRRHHVPLITQQRRLRHLRSICARNITALDLENDSFAVAFTLHKGMNSPAFYSSEVIKDNLNPSWKEFESSNLPDNVDTASPYVIVKVWSMEEERKLLIEWAVFFSGLVYLGEQIPKEGKNFKPNTVIFGMSEGYYGCDDCYQHNGGNSLDINVKDVFEADASGLRTSCTLSTLSRIKTVERAIKQTQAAAQRRRNSINVQLQSCQERHQVQAQRELLKIRISILKGELQYQQQISSSLEDQVASYKENLINKKIEMNKKKEEQKKFVEKCQELSKSHIEIRESFLKTDAQLNLVRKKLISELSSLIYPIVEFPDGKGFSIHNVHLPNSENFSGHDDTMIAVALGYVCHSVLMMSQFLNVPLRYLINFYGSRSTIIDHISSCLPENSREFPLHMKGRDKKPFEYGVFLLNKDIAQLRIFCRLPTKDLSATLPNLSSLIQLKFSSNNDEYLPEYRKQALMPVLNGVEYLQKSISPSAINEADFLLKREMVAMLPQNSNATSNNLEVPFKSKDASNALSSSLDKGLNEIKQLEKSLDTLEMENKNVSSKKLMQSMFMAHHHSSFPNLNSSLSAARDYNGHGADSRLLTTPPKVWTADSSRTNSEDEPLDEDLKQRKPKVLNDSIFYIPSIAPDDTVKSDVPTSDEKQYLKNRANADDEFSADLSLRTQQLSNKRSSFQLQRFRSSSNDEQLSNV